MPVRRDALRFGRLLALFTALFGAALVTAWIVYGRPRTGVDDAAIAFVYGEHLAGGHGFVYNIGGERVEGFTSPLWVALLSGLFSFFDGVELPLYVLNLLVLGLATACAAWLLDTYARFDREPKGGVGYAVVIFAAWLVAAPAYVAWSVLSLLEVGLYGSLLLLATCLLLWMLFEDRAQGKLGQGAFTGLIGLLVLARPESMLVAPVLIGLGALVWASRHGAREGARCALLPLSAYAVTLGLLVLIRISYFGYPLPNTYYAKVSPDLGYNLVQGGHYLVSFLHHNPLALIPLAAALVGTPLRAASLRSMPTKADAGDDRRRSLAEIVLGVVILTLAVVPVLNGGDHFAQSRFYQPLWPFLALYALFRARRELGEPLSGPVVAWAGRSRRLALTAALALAVVALTSGVRWDQVDRRNAAIHTRSST
jgi:arabinofuranosyltransferase